MLEHFLRFGHVMRDYNVELLCHFVELERFRSQNGFDVPTANGSAPRCQVRNDFVHSTCVEMRNTTLVGMVSVLLAKFRGAQGSTIETVLTMPNLKQLSRCWRPLHWKNAYPWSTWQCSYVQVDVPVKFRLCDGVPFLAHYSKIYIVASRLAELVVYALSQRNVVIISAS